MLQLLSGALFYDLIYTVHTFAKHKTAMEVVVKQ